MLKALQGWSSTLPSMGLTFIFNESFNYLHINAVC